MTSVATAGRDHACGTLPRRRIIGPARAVCRLTMAINGVDYRVEPERAERVCHGEGVPAEQTRWDGL